MTDVEYSRASEAATLCKECGLCCSGHLFSWVRLKASELPRLQKLGVNVIRSDPRQRGFTQPCLLWDKRCTIYESIDYPRGCASYNCKLLRELLDESVSLSKALRVVKQAKNKIEVVEGLLTPSTRISFRERVIERLEQLNSFVVPNAEESNFQLTANELLDYFDKQFGVNDFLEPPQSEQPTY